VTSPDGLPPLRDVIAAAQLTARRSLGQNFILDLNLTRRIARAGGPLDKVTVVEVGAGPGGLTRALLLEGAGRVIAVERDQRCLPALHQIADRYPGRLDIVEADALSLNYAGLAAGPVRVIANLPYNIATELLTRWLREEDWPPWYDRLVLMFQREVAERIVAAPGGKVFGRLAVLAQWRTHARILFNLPPQAFTPPPKVASALVELVPRQAPEDAGTVRTLEAVTAAAFGQRRKMLKSSLGSLGGEPAALLTAAAIDPALRAEQLSVSDYCALARALHARTDHRSV
jgi:16S rRNA (adenine1518-N6/adenine1519-N6)-dimethyltransferase